MTTQSSARCFKIDERASLSRLQDMSVGRQYFSTVVDHENEEGKTFIYVISGFNHEKVVSGVERFCWEDNEWVEIAPVNTPRINASACKCGSKHIYLFGGMDVAKNEFTD